MLCFEVTSDIRLDIWETHTWVDEDIYCNNCGFKKEQGDLLEA